jgi:hypothetical protein
MVFMAVRKLKNTVEAANAWGNTNS